MSYFDCAASAPVLPCAVEAMRKAYANPNAGHAAGREARKALEDARARIAHCLNAEPHQIAFTPSATAACHYALYILSIDDCRSIEHKAVYDYTDNIRGFVYGNENLTHMLANNETGALYYVEVQELAKTHDVFTDATAAVGQFPIDVQDLGVAALAAGGHKFGAFPGIGFLYMRDGIKDEDVFPGTPPVSLAVGMANALEYRMENIIPNTAKMLKHRSEIIDAVFDIPGGYVNDLYAVRLPNIVSARFDGVNARELLTALDARGVYCSAGAACTTNIDEPSRVLLATGLTEEEALSTIRISFCHETTEEDFHALTVALIEAVEALRCINE